jgi:glycosyltransferase involved in cell wall biosynthesis
VLIEALACGRTIVATDAPGGTREILDGGRYGTLVPVGDAEALGAAIAAAIESPADPDAQRAGAARYAPAISIARYRELLSK